MLSLTFNLTRRRNTQNNHVIAANVSHNHENEQHNHVIATNVPHNHVIAKKVPHNAAKVPHNHANEQHNHANVPYNTNFMLKKNNTVNGNIKISYIV